MSKRKNEFDKKEHVFLSLLPGKLVLPFARKLKFISQPLTKISPSFEKDLEDKNYAYKPFEYMGIGLISYTIVGLIFGILIYFLFLDREATVSQAVGFGILIWFVTGFLLTYLGAKHVEGQLKLEAVDIDRNLNYALKDMILSARSGGTLFEALVSVANAGYGVISKEFDLVVREVNVGKSLNEALEHMIKRTRSDYLRKTGWRLINNFQTGSNLEISLSPIVAELETFQKIQIQNYAKELGLWSLIYMLFSVAIPTIGSTILTIVSAFAQVGSTVTLFILFIIFNFIVQIALIILVKNRRPNVAF